MRFAVALTVLLVTLLGTARASDEAPSSAGVPADGAPPLLPLADLPAPPRPEQHVRWRDSVAVGRPYAGRLRRGVRFPAEGDSHFTWDPIRETTPNRGWRRWGTDRLVRTTLQIARRYRRENPGAPRLAIGDLSRPRGGDFGPQYGELGHASHQNGLDVDIYYPRRDRRETAPTLPGQVDVRLSQRLVDMFVAAGAEKVFVGPSLDLRGPRRVVEPLVYHDNHLHARLPG